MKFMKKEYLQRKTRERGQASWVLGLFLILFLAILLCMQLQVALYRESAMYMEDALALSNLASAVIDIEEYGITQKVLITDPEQAYERYCHALRENLGLDNHFMAQNRRMIVSPCARKKPLRNAGSPPSYTFSFQPVSSIISRQAASEAVSPGSINPAGSS